MSGARGSGFTIIEVMLFLAISSLMAVGIMAGASVAINVQRYKDATHSFQSFIQSQYDKAINVQNDRKSSVKCDGATIAAITDPADPEATPGAAVDCYIYGRLLTVSEDGKKITAQAVYGSTATNGDDISSLASAKLFVDTTGSAEIAETYTPEWSTQLVKAKAQKDQSFAMDDWRLLIVRSPSSGAVRTFTTFDKSLISLQAVVESLSSRSDVTICLDSNGLMNKTKNGITIKKDTAAASGVGMAARGEC